MKNKQISFTANYCRKCAQKKTVVIMAMALLLFANGATGAPNADSTNGYEISYDNGNRNWAASDSSFGLAVRFTLPASEGYINKVRLYGSRYGTTVRNFDIEIWDANLNTLYSASYPYNAYFPESYNTYESSIFNWAEISVPNTRVSGDFYIVFFSHTGAPPWADAPPGAPDGGVQIGLSESGNRRSYEVTKNPNAISSIWRFTNISQSTTDFMIRAVICNSDSPCNVSKTAAYASNPLNPLAEGSEKAPVSKEATATKHISPEDGNNLLKKYSTIYSYYADISENARGDAPFKLLKKIETYANKLKNELTPKINDIPKDVVNDVNPFSDLNDFITNGLLVFHDSMRFLQQADFIFQLADDTENSKILQDIAPKLKELSEISNENPSDITKQNQLISSIKSDLDKINFEKYIKKGVDAKPVIITKSISEGESFNIELDMPDGAYQINYKKEQKENYKSLYGLLGSDYKYDVNVLNNPDNLWWNQNIKSMTNREQDFWSDYTNAISWQGSTSNQPKKIQLEITCIDTGGDIDFLLFGKKEGTKTATVTLKFVFAPEKSYSYGLGDFLRNYKESLYSGLEKHEWLLNERVT